MESLAWHQEQNNKCKCGGWLDETTHPDNEDAYEGHVVRCFKCRAQQAATKEYAKNDNSEGLYSYAVKDAGHVAY